jgi:hypothetical protein
MTIVTGRTPAASTRSRARRPRRRAGALLLVTALGAFLAAGCGGARNALGTTASACFHDLPEAKAAVGGKGQLVGVRRVSTAALRSRLPNNQALAQSQVKDLCVLAFHGTYRPGDIPAAANTTEGRYAMVAVELAHPKVVAVVVLDQLPTRFNHLR